MRSIGGVVYFFGSNCKSVDFRDQGFRRNMRVVQREIGFPAGAGLGTGGRRCTGSALSRSRPCLPQCRRSLASRAWAGTPESKHDLERRVAEAARMLAGRPRLKGVPQAQREKHVEFVVGNLLFVLGHEAGHAAIRDMGFRWSGARRTRPISFRP